MLIFLTLCEERSQSRKGERDMRDAGRQLTQTETERRA